MRHIKISYLLEGMSAADVLKEKASYNCCPKTDHSINSDEHLK